MNIKNLMKIDLFKYIYYNYICHSVVRGKKNKLIPYRHSIIVLHNSSKLVLEDDLILNDRKIGKSKAEAYLILGKNSSLYIKGKTNIRFGSTIQINQGAEMTIGGFSCNAGINIQCNKHISIGKDCMIGRNVVIYDSSFHPTGSSVSNMAISERDIIIGDHVWLGSYAIIMQGSIIEDGAVIGTHSCISGLIKKNSLVSPAFDSPSLSGVVWAKSLKTIDINNASKYEYSPDIVVKEDMDEDAIRETEDKLYAVLQKKLDTIDFIREKNLVDDHIIDSLMLLSICAEIENDFDIIIPYNDVTARNFNSVYNIASLICRIKREKRAKENIPKKTITKANILTPLDTKISETKKPVVQRIIEYSYKEPSDIAIIANDIETTYETLRKQIISISRWVSLKGIQSGDCVTIQAIHDEFCIACFYSVHLLGAILVPTEKSATNERIYEIAKETNSKMVIGNCTYDCSIPWYDYDTIKTISNKNNYPMNMQFPDIDSPCEMVFTTGTTGKSKGVLMTHRNISWYAYSLAKSIEMKKGNRFFITTPLNHAGGLRRTHLSLANGCCVVYEDGISDLNKYFEYIEKYHVTSLYLPPIAIRILLTRSGKELLRFKNQIDFVYSSSSPMPVGDCLELQKLLPETRLYNAYEASETPGVSAYNYNQENINNNCMGKANEGVEIAILYDNRITHDAKIEGQICVRSKMNMKEYYQEPELTKTVWNDDWFVSNDIGYLDEDGNVYYRGRKGDVINLGGYKIAPTDVEEIALLSGLVNECILIESKDNHDIPFLELLIVVGDRTSFDQSKLIAFLAARLEAYKIPRKITIVNEIHKTFNGKINRKAYR